ncbi:WD repeat-containing protein WRAP73 [Fasciola hepatica]|uniref:WD repeat-containing protein WRAP73 n=1 Tax=Fasciola hepatica TaxID=6192 RepID=A0A4E0R9C1_FASHE|nr:WD repeat-containing protein WRAP73 [Fasciola hepatica]
MNFSEPLRLSNGLAEVSPNSLYVASAAQHKITVRVCSSLQVFQIYGCVDVIHNFSWSPDSSFILCVLKKRGIVQVLSLENPDYTCKVDEGSTGLLSAEWAPDSRHFLTVTEFYLRITVWSLSEVAVSYLKFAKVIEFYFIPLMDGLISLIISSPTNTHVSIQPCANNLAFSPGGRYLALIERRDFRDHLSLFDCHANWQLLRNVQLDTQDAVGLRWSPDGRFLAVWDDCLRYRVALYTVDGRHVHSYCAYEPGQDLLGVKSICWSPSGQLLAIGSYDQKCRLLNSFNWSCLISLSHPTDKPINPALGLSATGKPIQIDGELDSRVPDTQEAPLGYRPHRIDVYQEYRTDPSALAAEFRRPQPTEVVYRLVDEAITIPSIKPDPKLPNPKIGVGLASFSKDGRFLATRNDNAPRALWIWSIDRRLSLFSLLIHTSGPVQCLAWDPTTPARLALCTGSDSVFMWTPQGCLVVQTPSHFKFSVSAVNWFPRGDALLLLSESHFCLCYLGGADGEKQCLGERDQNPMWEPPKRQFSDLPFPRISSNDPDNREPAPSLPLGVFGPNPKENEETEIPAEYVGPHVGDTPNWLRRRVAPKPDKVSDRCRSCSTDVMSRSHPNRTLTTVSSRRQAWAPAHKSPLGASERQSANELS